MIVEAAALDEKRDVAGAQLLKIFENVTHYLGEFEIKEKGWEWDEENPAVMWWTLEKKQLPAMMIHEGPPENALFHKEAFAEKYPKAFVKNHRLYARVKRPWTMPQEILDILKTEDYVKERCKHFVVKWVRTNE